MNQTLMMDQVYTDYVKRLRADGCRRCVKVRASWVQTEFRAPFKRRR